MQCQSCHQELVEGAKFCKFCGAKQEVPVPELLNQEEQQDFSYPQTETKTSPKEIPIASDPQKNAAESVQPLVETSSSVQPIQFGGEEQSEEDFTSLKRPYQQEEYTLEQRYEVGSEQKSEAGLSDVDVQEISPVEVQEEVELEAGQNDFLNALREFQEDDTQEERISNDSDVETVKTIPLPEADLKRKSTPISTTASNSQRQEKKFASENVQGRPQETGVLLSAPTKKAHYSKSKISIWSIIWRLFVIFGECAVIACYIWFFVKGK